MQNFGRGMWRRVGDFERIHKPMLIQQSRLEQWQQFVQQQDMLKKQQTKTQNLTQKQEQVPDSEPAPESEIEPESAPEDNLVKLDLSIENKSISIEENNITQELDIINTPDELQNENSEPPVVIPKKAKRKNKKL
jgi:hypothetical protein